MATGGDGALRLWRLERSCGTTTLRRCDDTVGSDEDDDIERHDRFVFIPPMKRLSGVISNDLSIELESLLRDFVSFQSISGRPAFLEECWRAARFLCSCFEAIGAVVKLIDIGTGHSPLVASRLGDDPNKPTVLFYSHYDVVPATASWSSADVQSRGGLTNSGSPLECSVVDESSSGSILEKSSEFRNSHLCPLDHRKSPSCKSPMSTPRTSHWHTDPWQLTALDGYYYGRGVTDNKGPILAQIFAVLGLLQQSPEKNDLPVNVVWLSEGEEESGSSGFEKAVHRLQETSDIVTGVTCVVCTNSYWVDDTKPCIV